MESESHNQRLFYKLIKKQRSGPQMKLSRLFVNDVHLNTEDEIREGWAGYFEELSRPKIIETFDVEYKEQVETDMKCIQQTCEAQQDRSKLDLTHEHILEVVTKLKNGKSADENNITAESIKFGGSVLIDYLQILFGKIVSEKEIPEPFKCGIITPIYKKNNKPLEDPNSYRRITVSSIIGKIFEKIHLDSMESLITSQQNDLQRGFTKNTSPVYAGLILTEALAEAMDTKQTLYAGFLDASKAFDVVWHDSMLRKLYIQGLEGTDWLLLKNWYTGMRSKVKWGGGYSSAFLESQGVRQGGIWSPTAYKIFINPALDLYETYHLGFKIGSVHLGSPTCADDELLLSTKYQELRTMVNIQETYANRERYTLSEAKSKVMVFNKMARTKKDSGYIELNNKELEIVDSYTHIGIERHSKVKAGDKGKAAVMIARKTTYSLLGAGFHGYNGVNPKVSIKMWAMYVKPRMLYGLESQILKRKDIDAINHYHKKVIKQLMHLPQRTADAAVYILAGDIPIEGDLHIKILGQLGNIFRSNGVERKLAERQLAMKEGNSASWFIYAKSILERYDLPSIYDLLESPPAKTEWNALIRKKVVTTWIDKVTTEAKSKSTLRHLCKAPYKKGTVHNLWRYASDDTIAVKKAGVKAKLVTGSYTLQADHASLPRGCKMLTIAIGAIVIYVIWEALRPEPKPVCGVYRLPGRWYMIKKALFLCLYKIRQRRNKKKAVSAGDKHNGEEGREDRGYGQSLSPLQLEQVPQLDKEPYGIDSVYFGGMSDSGTRLAIRMARRHNRCVEIWLVLEIPGIGVLEHPVHPDTHVINTSPDQYNAGGLRIEMIEPMKKWRVSFNGLLRWKATSDPFNFDSDIDAGVLADGLAKEKWTREFFRRLRIEHQTHYEQWGEISGKLSVEGHNEQFIRLTCVRDHSFGVRDWRQKYRYAIHFIFVESGLMIQTGVVSMPATMSNLKIGYLIYPSGETWPVSDIDLKLWEVAEDKTPKTQYSFNFIAGKKNYHVEVEGETTPIWYHHDDRGSKIYEIFSRYKVNGRKAYGITEFHYRNFDGPSYSQAESVPLICSPPRSDLDMYQEALTLTFDSVGCCSPDLVGGKGAQLGLLTQIEEKVGGKVPRGFCLTLTAFNKQVEVNKELRDSLESIKEAIRLQKLDNLSSICSNAVEKIASFPVHDEIASAVKTNMVELFGEDYKNRHFAVRSSAAGEDGSEASSAGQMETFLGVKGYSQIIDAVRRCWASAFTYQGIQYRRHLGQEVVVSVGVIIQEMVPSDISGVLFTNHPVTGSCNHMTIDATYGLGEAVVSGKVSPDSITVLRQWDGQVTISDISIGQKSTQVSIKDDGGVKEEAGTANSATCCLNDEQIIELSKMCIQIEEYLGSPRDVEWAMKDGKFYLLQARPITTLDRETDEDLIHEFDDPLVTGKELLTTGNIGEMMPGAITPLTHSTFKRAIDRGVNTYSEIAAGGPYVEFPAKMVLSCCGHNFINMNNVDAIGIYNIHGKKENAELNLLGQTLPELTVQEVQEYAGNFRSLYTRIVTTFLYIFKSRKRERICEGWQKRLESYTVGQNAGNCEELYKDISRKLSDYDEIWSTGITKSANSGVWASAVIGIISQGKTEYEPQHWSDIALLLSKCDDVYSAEVPTAVQSLARAIAHQGLKERFLSSSDKDCVALLNDKNNTEVNKQYKTFMERHGHRYIREAELLERSWKAEPEKLVSVIKAILRSGSYEERQSCGLSVDEAMSQIQTPLGGFARFMLKKILIKGRKAVGQREFGKSVSVKLADKFKEAYWQLADMMTREGRLPEKDLLFYLTHSEIGKLIETRSPKLVSKAFRRRKIFPKLMKLKFPKFSEGPPLPVQEEEFQKQRTATFTLKGLPVCSGKVTGIARVVKSLEEADNIERDDILIVSYTDVGWSPYFPLIAGLVTEMGGLLSHGAVVAREYGMPCLVNVPNATQLFNSGDHVCLNGINGTIEKLQEETRS